MNLLSYSRGTKQPQVDAIRDTLKVIDINGLNQINQHIVKKTFENKVFANGTIDGYKVVAIDGTKFFGSNKKSCPECIPLYLFFNYIYKSNLFGIHNNIIH